MFKWNIEMVAIFIESVGYSIKNLGEYNVCKKSTSNKGRKVHFGAF